MIAAGRKRINDKIQGRDKSCWHTVGKYVLVVTLGITAFSNASANHVKGTINLPGLPADIAVNNLTNRIYVAIPSFGGPTDTLAVIDGTTDTLINSISIPTVGIKSPLMWSATWSMLAVALRTRAASPIAKLP